MDNNGNVLNKLIAGRVLTPHSVAALKVALDGWHDTTISDFAGIPDRHVGRLFTFDDVSEVSINKLSSPVPLPAGSWSVRIAANPFGARTLMVAGTVNGSVSTYDGTSAPTVHSNVQLDYAQDGIDFIQGGAPGVNETASIMQMSPEFLTSKLKLCGCAIEVVNTTPQLTKGGLVTACNVPQPPLSSNFQTQAVVSAGVGVGSELFLPVRMVSAFPVNLAAMAKYSPFQAGAEDGVYINARMQFSDVTPTCMPIAPMICSKDLTSSPSPFSIPTLMPQYSTITVGGATYPYYANALNWFDMDSPCIMFTGLSDTTTLTVRVRWFGQIVPDDDNNIFLRAAHPAPIYDPNFFEIYSKACGIIPQACSFTKNPSGEWWKMALGAIARAAAPLLMMIPHPLAKAAGIAAGGAGALLEDAETESRVRRRKKNRNENYGEGVRKNTYGTRVSVKTGKPVPPAKKSRSIPNAPPSGWVKQTSRRSLK